MADDNDNTPEEKSGIGALGIAASVTGGVAAGGVTTKVVVDKSIKNNIVKPYADAMKPRLEALKAGLPEIFPEGQSAADARHNAEAALNIERDALHEGMRSSADRTIKALFDRNTTLGKASGAAVKKNADTNWKQSKGTYDAAYKKVGDEAEKVIAATGPARSTAEEKLLKVMGEEASKIDAAHAAEKVKELSWAKRLNPLAGDLHLSGKQKGMAIASGLVVTAIGAFGLAKVFGMGSDKGQGKS